MFSKIWKTLKLFLIIAIILICLPHSILPVQRTDSHTDSFESYRKLNENETRLNAYKDDDNALRIKVGQLEIINKSRRKFRANEVKLDILASRVANKMCKEAAENNFMGHWNMAGEKPYHRYGFAGGYDHISENAFGEWSSDKYDTTYASISSLMKSGHGIFMAEKAPNDGHKKTVIEKSHNFVGIGFCLTGKQFRYYEEFIDRYLEFENIPAEVAKGEPVSITVKTNGESFLYYLMVYREIFPQPMTPDQINARGSYDDFTRDEYLVLPAWDLLRYRNGKIYTIPLKFTREGLYYIHIYTDKKEIHQPLSLNTRGKTPVSGIVIRVNN